MDERVIFSHQGVTVGYSNFSVNQKTYPIKDIMSVEPRMLKPKRFWPRLLVFSSLPMILSSGFMPSVGAALLLIGFLWGKTAKVRYALVIHTRAERVLHMSSNFCYRNQDGTNKDEELLGNLHFLLLNGY